VFALTLARGLKNEDKRRSHRSQSRERVSAVDCRRFTFLYLYAGSVVVCSAPVKVRAVCTTVDL